MPSYDAELARAIPRLLAAASLLQGASNPDLDSPTKSGTEDQEFLCLAQLLDEALERWRSNKSRQPVNGLLLPAASPMTHAPFKTALLALFPPFDDGLPLPTHHRGQHHHLRRHHYHHLARRTAAACLLREAAVRWLLQHLADADDLEQTAAAYQAKQAIMACLRLLPPAVNVDGQGDDDRVSGGHKARAAALLRWDGLAAEAACSSSMARARPQTVAKLAAVLGLGKELGQAAGGPLTEEGE